MANTYHQIYVQIVFSVKNRENIIPSSKKDELHKYITGIVKNKNCKLIAINSMHDHIHIFVGLHPTTQISELVKEIKKSSTEFIKTNNWIKTKFNWQDGYGAFSYGHSQIEQVYKYIMNQEEHHKKKTFKEEYVEFLKKFGVDYNEKYVLDIE
jgi:REP element-mobilizing transposase RayT